MMMAYTEKGFASLSFLLLHRNHTYKSSFYCTIRIMERGLLECYAHLINSQTYITTGVKIERK